MEPLQSVLGKLVGKELEAVTFVQDYLQLDFDGSRFTVMSGVRVSIGEWTVASGESGFRDQLCGRIGKHVRSCRIAKDATTISFEDDSSIALSMLPTGGPEAFTFQLGGALWVV